MVVVFHLKFFQMNVLDLLTFAVEIQLLFFLEFRDKVD
jgi:hypothetical protein